MNSLLRKFIYLSLLSVILCFLTFKYGAVTQSAYPETIYNKTENIKYAQQFGKGFLPVDNSNETFVYSAFYDNRSHPVIRVIVIVRDNLKLNKFKCLSENAVNGIMIFKASLEYIPEPNWKYPYRSGIINCMLDTADRPHWISVTPTTNTGTTIKVNNRLIIQYPDSIERGFTRCVPAFHLLNNTMSLIQMVESDLMFGMEHFIMYNYTGSALDKVLHTYTKDGVVDLLPWNLPISPQHIHYFGQLANMHDCLYRNLYVSKYVFFADVDEIVVSEIFPSWQHLAKSKFQKHLNCGLVAFRNAFFPAFFPNTEADFSGKSEALKYDITFLLKTTHTEIHSIGYRSKLLVKPETIYFMGIHSIERFFDIKFQTCKVTSTKEALLHHYRPNKSVDMNYPYMENTNYHKFSLAFIERIRKRLQRVKDSSVSLDLHFVDHVTK